MSVRGTLEIRMEPTRQTVGCYPDTAARGPFYGPHLPVDTSRSSHSQSGPRRLRYRSRASICRVRTVLRRAGQPLLAHTLRGRPDPDGTWSGPGRAPADVRHRPHRRSQAQRGKRPHSAVQPRGQHGSSNEDHGQPTVVRLLQRKACSPRVSPSDTSGVWRPRSPRSHDIVRRAIHESRAQRVMGYRTLAGFGASRASSSPHKPRTIAQRMISTSMSVYLGPYNQALDVNRARVPSTRDTGTSCRRRLAWLGIRETRGLGCAPSRLILTALRTRTRNGSRSGMPRWPGSVSEASAQAVSMSISTRSRAGVRQVASPSTRPRELDLSRRNSSDERKTLASATSSVH